MSGLSFHDWRGRHGQQTAWVAELHGYVSDAFRTGEAVVPPELVQPAIAETEIRAILQRWGHDGALEYQKQDGGLGLRVTDYWKNAALSN